jgi:hypothetical protein
VSEWQLEPRPYIEEPFSERVDQPIIVMGRRRDARPLGAARDGRIVDRLDVDAVIGKQKIARLLEAISFGRSEGSAASNSSRCAMSLWRHIFFSLFERRTP